MGFSWESDEGNLALLALIIEGETMKKFKFTLVIEGEGSNMTLALIDAIDKLSPHDIGATQAQHIHLIGPDVVTKVEEFNE